MLTASSLKEYKHKDLAQMAKKRGVQGWHSMRKDQLVRALLRNTKPSQANNGTSKKNGRASDLAPLAAKSKSPARAKMSRKSSGGVSTSRSRSANSRSSRVMDRIHKVQSEREQFKDLAHLGSNGQLLEAKKDRVVLLVRDSYWLQAYWEITRRSIDRVQAAMAEHWHTSLPCLRLYELESGTTTGTFEKVARDIVIHGGVRNWYIDVVQPPMTYCVEIGYLATNGRFHALARSNGVTTPLPGSADAMDENWTDIAENYEKIFAMSGGYAEGTHRELQELFEEQLRRPVGSPADTQFGDGAQRILNRPSDFSLQVDAEMIVFGRTKPSTYVTLGGEPVRLRSDGSFTVRVALPDKRQVIPVVASSANGVEQRTVVLAVERNTKVMEPVVRDSGD